MKFWQQVSEHHKSLCDFRAIAFSTQKLSSHVSPMTVHLQGLITLKMVHTKNQLHLVVVVILSRGKEIDRRNLEEPVFNS